MFHPQPEIQVVPLHDGHACLVVDDVLTDPGSWRRWAIGRSADFRPSGHAYPGVELWLDDQAAAHYASYLARHLGARLGVGVVLNAACRASLVSLAADELAPRQWFCHRDDRGLPEGERLIASVVYLFDDASLGGTAFYRPRRPAAEVEALVRDAGALRAGPFAARYPDIGRGYMVQGNAWFDAVASVPARYNRAIFYDGGLFHTGDIRDPARMSADPARGRLTLNGFLRCRRV